MINKDELMYKMEAIIDYLKNNNGENYKVYNHLCPDGKKQSRLKYTRICN